MITFYMSMRIISVILYLFGRFSNFHCYYWATGESPSPLTSQIFLFFLLLRLLFSRSHHQHHYQQTTRSPPPLPPPPQRAVVVREEHESMLLSHLLLQGVSVVSNRSSCFCSQCFTPLPPLQRAEFEARRAAKVLHSSAAGPLTAETQRTWFDSGLPYGFSIGLKD